jgi:hypothetical protein
VPFFFGIERPALIFEFFRDSFAHIFSCIGFFVPDFFDHTCALPPEPYPDFFGGTRACIAIIFLCLLVDTRPLGLVCFGGYVRFFRYFFCGIVAGRQASFPYFFGDTPAYPGVVFPYSLFCTRPCTG